MLTAFMAVLAAALFVAACNDAPSPTAPPPPTEGSTAAPGSAGLVAGQPGGMPEADFDPGVTGQAVPVEMAVKGGGCSGKKVAICHLPPGNPDNIQEICIADSAVPAHEAHGDYAPFPFWPDADGDGFGDAAAGESGCTLPPGYVENPDDCDDGDAAINPNAAEVCDGVDNDCNGTVDDGGDALCDNGVFCDGAETCDAFAGCQPGSDPCLTGEECNETTHVCEEPAPSLVCDCSTPDVDGMPDADGDGLAFCDATEIEFVNDFCNLTGTCFCNVTRAYVDDSQEFAEAGFPSPFPGVDYWGIVCGFERQCGVDRDQWTPCQWGWDGQCVPAP